jgi:hypothetical protein
MSRGMVGPRLLLVAPVTQNHLVFGYPVASWLWKGVDCMCISLANIFGRMRW